MAPTGPRWRPSPPAQSALGVGNAHCFEPQRPRLQPPQNPQASWATRMKLPPPGKVETHLATEAWCLRPLGQVRRGKGHNWAERRVPPTLLRQWAGCQQHHVPMLYGANLGTPALPHPCLAGTRALGMWLWILSPGATDSCLSGRGWRTAFNPLILASSREPGHTQALPARPQGRPGGRPRRDRADPLSTGTPAPRAWACSPGAPEAPA